MPAHGLVLTRMFFSWMPAFSTIFILIPDRASMFSSTFLSSLARLLFGVYGTNITALGLFFLAVCWAGAPLSSSLSLSLHSFFFSLSSFISFGLFLNHEVFPVSFFLFLFPIVCLPFLWNLNPSLFLLFFFLSRPRSPQTMISLAFFLE